MSFTLYWERKETRPVSTRTCANMPPTWTCLYITRLNVTIGSWARLTSMVRRWVTASTETCLISSATCHCTPRDVYPRRPSAINYGKRASLEFLICDNQLVIMQLTLENSFFVFLVEMNCFN